MAAAIKAEDECRQLTGRVPPYFHRWNKAHRGAYMNGARHAASGGSREQNPYLDKRKASGALTWSRSFISAWDDGFRAAKRLPA